MRFHVVPFMPNVDRNEGAAGAAKKLEELANHYAGEGWVFAGLENVEMVVTTPGSAGCLGFGAVPPSRDVTSFNMAVFKHE